MNGCMSACFSFGFSQSLNDYSLFVRIKQDTIVVLLVYVDNVMLTSNNIVEIEKVKEFLKSELIKDLGKLKKNLWLSKSAAIAAFSG